LAKELNVPVIAISQLSRAVEALGNRRPQLSHLRECVTGDTVVWDADTGRRYTIGHLAQLPAWPRLLSMDPRGSLVPVRPAAVLAKGKNAVFEISTSTGRRLRATANHPVLTPEGWKTVGSLHSGSLVAAAGPDGERDRRISEPGGMATGHATTAVLGRPSTRMHRAAADDVHWDRITRIASAGREMVYDLVMPGTHNFVANGLITHNSGELEQVADLVLFIYREDYYNENTEKKNIAEIIVSKHRNGPTGTIELYFNREHSRFIGLDRRRGGPNR